jgi:hypothetical protein
VLPLLCKWLDPCHGSDDHVNCSPVSAKDVKHKGPQVYQFYVLSSVTLSKKVCLLYIKTCILDKEKGMQVVFM